MSDTRPEPQVIDAEVISETREDYRGPAQGRATPCPRPDLVEPIFEEAAQILDAGLEAARDVEAAARASGLDVELPADLVDTVETMSEGLREAGVSVAKAKDAATAIGERLDQFGETLTKIRGGRGAFSRRVNF